MSNVIRDKTRINRFIRAPEVRCIDEKGEQIGVISTREALDIAYKRGLDLVEISPTAKPPVCRIMDYGKYRYEQERKDKLARKNQGASKIKEIKLHPNLDEHDYQTRLRQVRSFLEEGHRVKFSLFFRGRENVHQQIGFNLLNRFAQDCQDIGLIEQAPKGAGRSVLMQMCAKPGGAKKPTAE